MKRQWIGGNRLCLLENGEQFYPRLFERINQARHEVMIETFILFEDKVGIALHDVLLNAARRGVKIDLTIDSYGSPDLSAHFISSLTSAGVRLHVFDPHRKWFGLRTHMLRRMHRKLAVIDGSCGFIGGINFSADHLADFGPEAKLDHAAEVEGPIVGDMHAFMRQQLNNGRGSNGNAAGKAPRRWFRRRSKPSALPSAGHADAILVTRDNVEHTNDIERHYRVAIRTARKRVVIANAYFFPGYRLLRQLRHAARRGVDICLILQGQPDMPIVKFGAELLYHHLLRAGVRIFEFCERPMHSKVALADEEWATIGSSNLDPLSLSLNLEANLVIRDRDFNAQLSERLDHLMQHSCKEIHAGQLNEPRIWLQIRSFFVFHFLRHFPTWAGLLPTHAPRLAHARDELPDTSPSEETIDVVSEPGQNQERMREQTAEQTAA